MGQALEIALQAFGAAHGVDAAGRIAAHQRFAQRLAAAGVATVAADLRCIAGATMTAGRPVSELVRPLVNCGCCLRHATDWLLTVGVHCRPWCFLC